MERVPFRNVIGRSPGDDKIRVEEEGTIGDESTEDSVSMHGRQI